MEAGSLGRGAYWPLSAGRLRARLAVWISATLVAGLALCVALLAFRRIAGGLASPISLPAMFCAVALAALLAAAARFIAPRVGFGRTAMFCVRWLPGILLAAFVAALSLPGTAAPALAIGWAIVASEELLAWRQFRPGRGRRSTSAAPRQPPPRVERSALTELERSPIVERSPLAEPQAPLEIPHGDASLLESDPVAVLPPLVLLAPPLSAISPDVVQQSTRIRTAAGLDRLSGWLQMSLETGERNATAHIAFCPPFVETPRISLRQTAGPAGRVRAVQILPHGVRLELKLDQSPRQPQRVPVEFVVETRNG